MLRIIAAVVIAVGLAIPAWAGWDEGWAARERGDYEAALKEWRPLAEQGRPNLEFILGELGDEWPSTLNGGRQVAGLGSELLEAILRGAARKAPKAVLEQDPEVQNNLGVDHREHRDFEEAVKWFRRAAEQGHADGQFNLGSMYNYGWGVRQDYVEAAKWYKKAAEQGHVEAQYNLGVAYETGLGAFKDHALAVKWFREAAEQGHAEAQFTLGAIYEQGELVLQDYAEAVRWHRMAGEQGHAVAQFTLGEFFEQGKGVPQNYAEAVRWYREAAEQGDSWAQDKLAFMNYDGQDVAQSYAAVARGESVPPGDAEAAEWFRRFAEQGDAVAQFQLGLIYDQLQDDVEAVKWYREAAGQGYARAQYNLGTMYGEGTAVPQNDVLAHMWSNLAASRLPPGKYRDGAVRNRDVLEHRMTPAQIAEAQRLAREWMERHEAKEEAD